MLSIILLQDEFLQIALQRMKRDEEQRESQREEEPQISDERLAVLAIAYHNLGV